MVCAKIKLISDITDILLKDDAYQLYQISGDDLPYTYPTWHHEKNTSYLIQVSGFDYQAITRTNCVLYHPARTVPIIFPISFSY